VYVKELLERLDPEQREAVTHLGSPALVLAGAGSGKTRTLTHRAAWLVAASNVDPGGILAVTFTNKAANEMRDRLAAMSLPGVRRLDQMWVSTFHRACGRILRQSGAEAGIPADFAVADSGDQLSLLRRVLPPKKAGDPSPDAWLARIGRLKDNLIRPGQFRPATAEEELLARIYQDYQAELGRNNLLDFDDLLLETERLLREHPQVAERWRRRFHHLLVDEFQDTNQVQYRITRQLAGEGGGLFAVGDEDQSIYRWRGADPGNFGALRRDYPGHRVFLLERNYRSTPAILRAAGGVIARGTARTPKRLVAHRRGGDAVLGFVGRDDEAEAAWVVSEMRGLFLSRCRPGEVAVLYRVNAQSPPLERRLAAAGIPFRVLGGMRFYQRQEVKDLLAYLRLAVNPHDDLSFRRVVNTPPRGIGPTTLEGLEEKAAAAGTSLMEEARDAVAHGGSPGRKLESFVGLVRHLEAAAGGMEPEDLLREANQSSGYAAWLRGGGLPDGDERLGNLRELERQLRGVPPGEEGPSRRLAAFLDEVALSTDADDGSSPEAVSLMTLHSAKGLEFPVVFLVGMEEGLLPHSRALTDPEEMEEERRICYVGMTRAKDLLHLSRARTRLLYGRPVWNTPSRFLEDIPPSIFRVEEEGLAPARPPGRHTSPAPPRQGAPPPSSLRQEAYPLAGRVRHPVYGVGMVVAREGAGDDLRLTVSFPGKGIKKFLAKAAGFLPL
jgi:DNA helicase-2/ATP-dependent DNA helicase PcrA